MLQSFSEVELSPLNMPEEEILATKVMIPSNKSYLLLCACSVICFCYKIVILQRFVEVKALLSLCFQVIYIRRKIRPVYIGSCACVVKIFVKCSLEYLSVVHHTRRHPPTINIM